MTEANELIEACDRCDGSSMEYLESLYVDSKETVEAEVLCLLSDEKVLKVIIDGERKYFKL